MDEAYPCQGPSKAIRDGNPDETVNIVAHSQGTLVTLLSQAMLHADGYRSAGNLD